ncbi:MAG: hypothetical protein VXZ72_01915 [Chlamydiota bacterium]|nr:hypothetical protein [Chlamydiota bacterium]
MRSLILTLLISLQLMAETPQTLHYTTQVGDQKRETTWTITEKEGKTLYVGKSEEGTTELIVGEGGVNESFLSAHPPFQVKREGNQLHASRPGDAPQTLNLSGTPWKQSFLFSLKPFFLSAEKSHTFVIVRPTNLSLHRMIATKGDREAIFLHGKEYDSQKVKVTLTGFQSLFWQANLWFDPETGDLLCYEANEGPNTPLTIITLNHSSSKK